MTTVPERNGRLPVILIGAAVISVLIIVLIVVIPRDGPPGFQRWSDGSVHGSWHAIFDGDGRIGAQGGSILLSPKPSSLPAETHASLVISRKVYQDIDLSAGLRTIAQLRRPTPNPWEVAWLIWSYTDDQHFYYLALKPNGWELGKRDPHYPGGQRFLATGTPTFPPGHWYQIEVAQHGATMNIHVGGRPLVAQTDTEAAYTNGKVGLYSEDAQVEFRHIDIA